MDKNTQNTQKRTKKETFLIALENEQGHISNACKSANIHRRTYYTWIDKDEDFKQKCEDVQESFLDLAESKLLEKINDGDNTCIIFIHELSGIEGGYEEAVLKKICKIALENDVQAIIAESNYGDAMFNKLLIPVMQKICPDIGLMEEKVTGAKEVRMVRILEPVMAQHRLCFNTKAIKEKET